MQREITLGILTKVSPSNKFSTIKKFNTYPPYLVVNNKILLLKKSTSQPRPPDEPLVENYPVFRTRQLLQGHGC